MKNSIIVFGLIALALLIGLSMAHSTKQGSSLSLGGEFTLTDQNSAVITQENLKGKYTLVFFGFANCPDVCPTTLTVISQVMEDLGAEANKLTPVFISVDAGGDTPQSMKLYLSNFHPSILGLTGTEEQIKQATAATRFTTPKLTSLILLLDTQWIIPRLFI